MFNGISIVCFVEIAYWLFLLGLRHCFYLPDPPEKTWEKLPRSKIITIKHTAIEYLLVNIDVLHPIIVLYLNHLKIL